MRPLDPHQSQARLTNSPTPTLDPATVRKIRRIRRQLALGLYDLEARLDVVVARVIDEQSAEDPKGCENRQKPS